MFVNIDEFKATLKGRDIYVFGGNIEGIGISRMLKSYDLPVKAILDTRTFNQGYLRGVPVISPDRFALGPEQAVVIITTKHREYRAKARAFCEANAYAEGQDYFYQSHFCQYFPTIETVGLCNLRCFTCDMGVPGANHNQKMMPMERFEAVLRKMKVEIPFFNSVCLYLWGEPLLHPKVGEQIRLCHELGLATEFSSNLNNATYLEAFVDADPDLLIVTCSGFGEDYNVTHTGGDFEKFKANCLRLRELIDKKNAEVFVKLHYLVYKTNQGESLLKAKAFAESLRFQFFPILANIFPGRVHDHVVLGEPLPDEMLEANKYLVYDIDDQIAWAQRHKNKPCPVINAFPTVKWDGSVLHCCNMTKPTVGAGYLSSSLQELMKMRRGSGFCERCQEHGMHRVFEVNGREDNKMTAILQKISAAC